MSKLRTVINRQYLVALATILAINTFGFLAHIYITEKNEGYAELINTSGRQRMLSQRITLIISQINNTTDALQSQTLREQVRDSIQLFEQSHNLLSGKADPNRIEQDIREYYELSKLNQAVQAFIAGARLFSDTAASDTDLQSFMLNAKGDLLKDLNLAVEVFEQRSDELTNLQFIIQIVVFLISIITLIIIGLVILKPLRDKIISHEYKLADSIDKLEEEGNYKSMFLANMSHELRTPLNGILGVTALIKSKQIDPDMQEYVDIIDSSGTTLLGTIENILDLTKLEMEQMHVEERAFNPEGVLETIYQTFKYYPNANPVEVKKQFGNMPQWLKGDEQKIKQIINNLMSNAIKFTHEGYIKLIATYDDGCLEVEVTDTGVGIAKNKLKTIFEPFKQADSSTKRVYGGTGLGLAISKQIAQFMGGSLEVKSEEYQGTSFTLRLPLNETTADKKDQGSHYLSNIELSMDGHVLIVEDNDINYRVLAKMLEKMGLEHSRAADGAQSINKVRSNDYDLILMDYHMPNLNGIEAIGIMQLLDKKLPPIVMLTADISESARDEAFKVGVHDFLEKPIDVKRLQQVVLKCLSHINKA